MWKEFFDGRDIYEWTSNFKIGQISLCEEHRKGGLPLQKTMTIS